MINRSEAEWLHIDIMDGVFVPNLSFGPPVLQYVAKGCTKQLDVHLMVVNPMNYLDAVKALGARVMNIHYEACTHLHRAVTQIKEAGMMAGVTLNPSTPVMLLKDIIAELEKPGRDVRDDLPAPVLRDDVLDMADLKPGMVLTGTVRNVIDFGAFVDIGVHQDGLVHISEISEKYVKHPSDVLSVGDVVSVRVLSVDVAKKRISLSMKMK